jgi:hypothetical protein
MAPYIAALIVLIVAILFMVYKRVDGFEVVTTTLKPTDTLQSAMNLTEENLKKIAAMKKALESVPEFDDVLTPAKMDELGIAYTMIDGKADLNGRKVSSVLLDILSMVEKQLLLFMDAVAKLNPTMKLNVFLNDSQQLTGFLTGMDLVKKTLRAQELYVNSKVASKTTIAGVTSQDLFDAVSGTKEAVTASTVDASGNDIHGMESTAAAAPSTTPIATKEMEDRIAKSVATQLKDTLLSQRSTSNPAEDIACPYASYDSTATSQGQEYRQVKPAQPAPDMSEYIRKDSIPCWNCSLP